MMLIINRWGRIIVAFVPGGIFGAAATGCLTAGGKDWRQGIRILSEFKNGLIGCPAVLIEDRIK